MSTYLLSVYRLEHIRSALFYQYFIYTKYFEVTLLVVITQGFFLLSAVLIAWKIVACVFSADNICNIPSASSQDAAIQ